MIDNRYMVFGVQESGKTTFAAALWHLIDSQEISTALVKGRHVGDFSYLQEISDAWAEGYEVERTRTQQVENIRINLQHPDSGSEMCLAFDDLSGETLEQAFATRYCSEKFIELVESAEGMLLFLSAKRNNDDAVTILDVFDAEEDTSQRNADASEWDPKKAPLQVQLVDLLQCLQRSPFTWRPMKVVVVISAWDLVADQETAPATWLNDRYPFLRQYLDNADGILEWRVYGVSAQGGRLSKKKDGQGPDREKLLEVVPASKRIKIVGPDVVEHDITRPLLWLAGLEAAS